MNLLETRFLESIPALLKDVVKGQKELIEVRRQALYPYPDLCRVCADRDTASCESCVPCADCHPVRRAVNFKRKD